MYPKKKWWSLTLCIVATVILTACGNGKSTGSATQDGAVQDNPRNHTAEDFVTISDALEENAVWIVTDQYPDRNSRARELLIFDNGEVTRYSNLVHGDALSIEEMNDLTDSEVIERYKEISNVVTRGPYTLNIILDNLGQYTDKVEVLLNGGTIETTFSLDSILEENYSSSGREEIDMKYSNFESYAAGVKNGDHKDNVKIVGDDYIITDEVNSSVVTFVTGSAQQTIFDTTYTGLSINAGNNDKALFTRTDGALVGFKLNDPDSKGKNITIEGK